MIYSSFKDVAEYYERVNTQINYAKEAATSYISDVVEDAGPIEVTLREMPALLIRKDRDTLIYIKRLEKPSDIKSLSHDELLELCKELHDMHLVKEWREDETEDKEVQS